MEIATWNVNSIRTRLEQVCQWLEHHPVDYLCLQETKVVDELFPHQPFLERGYQVYCAGQKSYNGVAIVSRRPLDRVEVGFASLLPDREEFLDEQKRLIMGCPLPDVALINVYIPNGSSVGSDKYAYKLAWLEALRIYLDTLQGQSQTRIILCGDFNIAPEDRDIHDPSDRENHIMSSEPERQALEAIRQGGLVDAFRHGNPETGHYSWWDYRQGSFRRNRGWRIDHHYISEALLPDLIGCTIDVQPRGLPQPSDHAPVILSLGLEW
ncbi:exodeoxyribonuclease III [Candidatus Synechococcus calcipolaris G9]|uniref:Exodeoxyribonuclease III n=1 Tax=Candidatus Synechococcus calcipolaris G9 TaxID=1497997 RepID=A0ABT6EZL6_9SYNE|nr:exodeoxyribonuclease III [Candidatus Synechococcus calcipolaris]MDG2991019.1 exodeoxyribonuclease III [Candidatus Synechococcus calcipolaris G9]